MSLGAEVVGGDDARSRAAYDGKVARWRNIVDWAKHRPWVMRLVGGPLSRGTGRLRFVDRLLDRAIAVEPPDFREWSTSRLAVCWIGHATMLVRVGGRTLLTDPVWSSRVGLGWGLGTLGPARFVKPACAVSALPAVDLVLLSHAHFDHLDRPTLARLPKSSTVICAAGTRDLVDDLGFLEVLEVRVGETIVRAGLTITAVPVRHWGARTVLDAGRGYCGFLIEADDGTRVLYGGDSAHQAHWKSIGDSGGVDLAIVGIGAYDPWLGGHANPEQAWQMTQDAGARHIAAMHHRTFKLSNEPMAEPMRRFLEAAGEKQETIICRSIGEVWSRPA